MLRIICCTALLSLAVLLGFLLFFQGKADTPLTPTSPMTDADLDFTCVYEKDTLPKPDPEADEWFKQARQLEKAKPHLLDYAQIGALYRQAAERNHPKAMLNLSNLISYGKVPPLPGKGPAEEVWQILEKMHDQKISYGYYQIGYYFESGYGVNADPTKALGYFRQAADLGSPEA